jgi:hypothetical protein
VRYLTPLRVRELSVPDMKDYIMRLADGESYANLPAPGAFTVVHATAYINRVKGSRKVIADFNSAMDAVLDKAKKALSLPEKAFNLQFADYLPDSPFRYAVETKYRGHELDGELDSGTDVLPLTAKLKLKEAQAAIDRQVSVLTRAAKRKLDLVNAKAAMSKFEELAKAAAAKYSTPAELADTEGVIGKANQHEYLVTCVHQATVALTANVTSTGLRFMTDDEIRSIPKNTYDVELIAPATSSIFQSFCSAQRELGEASHAPDKAAKVAHEVATYVVRSNAAPPSTAEKKAVEGLVKKTFTELCAHFDLHVHPDRVKEEEEQRKLLAADKEAVKERAKKAAAAKEAASKAQAKKKAEALAAKAAAKLLKAKKQARGTWFTNEQLPDPEMTPEELTDL